MKTTDSIQDILNQNKSIIVTTKTTMMQQLAQYRETYYDTSKSKTDLKDSANEVIRTMSKLLDQQQSLNDDMRELFIFALEYLVEPKDKIKKFN